jgi:hypothetical protein
MKWDHNAAHFASNTHRYNFEKQSGGADTMIEWRLSSRLVTMALVALGAWRAPFAQQSAAQASPTPVYAGAAQLPNAPAPAPSPSPASPAPSAEPAPTAASSSSSSSAPDSAMPLRYWTSNDPNAQVTVLENTLLRVRTNQPISSRESRAGSALAFTLSEDVVVDDVLIVPRGALLHGTLVESKHAGALTGAPELILQLTSLDLAGRSYPLYTYELKVEGTSKTKPTERKVRNGALIGTVAGGLLLGGSAKGGPTAVGKLAGMGTGAVLGAGVGTVVSAATPSPIVSLPPESEMEFCLASPISVVPATEKEARRLSEGLHAGGPVLYVRGDTP